MVVTKKNVTDYIEKDFSFILRYEDTTKLCTTLRKEL
jgi:hypothetical protein